MAIDLNAIKAKLANKPKGKSEEGTQSNIKWVKAPREGQIKVIFLPPLHGETTPGMLQYTHWGIPELNRLTCLRTFEKTCPMCERLKEIQNKVPEDVLKAYRSQERSVHNVIVLEDPSIPENEPCVYTSSGYTYWWLLQSILDPETGDITKVEQAHPVTFKRVSAGGRFERIISLHGRPLAPTPEQIQEILKKAPDLKKIWKDSDDLYNKLDVAGKSIVEELLAKSEVLKESSIPTPTQVITPSENVSPQPASQPIAQPVSNPAPAAKATEKPKDAPDCWGQHSSENEKCGLCPFELDCEGL